MGINDKTKTYNKQIHHGNPLLEAAIRFEKEIPASMSFDDAERTEITQLEHHMKATTKSSKPSSTDGAAGRSKEVANNKEQIKPTKLDKKEGGKLDTISGAYGIFSNSTIQNYIKSEKDDDERYNKDETLQNNKKGYNSIAMINIV